jgi:hypothetical protein
VGSSTSDASIAFVDRGISKAGAHRLDVAEEGGGEGGEVDP